MVDASNFNQAWNAYVKQHNTQPKDANMLHKYSKINNDIATITYPMARAQWTFNKKVQSSSNDPVGNTNDIQTELEKLKQLYSNNYAALFDTDWTEFGSVDYDKTSVKIMQFNITLDKAIGNNNNNDQKDDQKNNQSADAWKYRGYRIVEIISNNDPDIITVQELNHYIFLNHYLTPKGYSSGYKLNTKSQLLEGVAIFYKSDQYNCVSTYFYGKDVEPKNKFNANAIVLILKHKTNNKMILICSTRFDSKDSISQRMNKLQYLLPSLNQISIKYNNCTIFIGCDLGSDYASPEYYSITNGRYYLSDIKKNIPNGYQEGYGLNLQSAYYLANYAGKVRKAEPKTTSNGKCRDYIFYDKNKGVTCSHALTTPIDFTHNTYPNWQHPSTHMPIMAQLYY